MSYEAEYSRYLELFEGYLNEVALNLKGHEKLVEAMRYSLLAGGKRVRPVLMLAAAEAFGGDANRALPLALSVECIHTYSLIHDDLPAMDDDDLRRGKPASHKVFGEAFAILAGDALLNFAFEHSLENAENMRDISALKYLAECAGYRGMIGGQAHDVEPQIQDKELRLLTTDKLKTSKLLTAPLVMAAIKFGGDRDLMEQFGEKLGIIYQFVDDLLDVVGNESELGKATNKDEAHGKRGAVAVYGAEGLRAELEKLAAQCETILKKVENNAFLLEFLHRSLNRKS